LELFPGLLAFIRLIQSISIYQLIKRTYGVSQHLTVISFQPSVDATSIFSLYPELKDGTSPWPQESLQAMRDSVRDHSGKNREHVLSALWPVVNHPLEGPVLWVVSAGHGLTVADLAAPVCLGVRIWLLRRALAARRIAQPRAADRSTP
jgi:hypothetical protein